MNSTMTYDSYMNGMEGLNTYRDDNDDLTGILNSNAYNVPTVPNPGDIFSFSGGFAPNGMNFDAGMMGGAYTQDNTFQQDLGSSGQPSICESKPLLPISQQQVDPAIIMKPQSFDGGEGSEGSQACADSQAAGNGNYQGSESSYGHSKESQSVAQKPKRTRRSKKKPLGKEQQVIKREEFLERNRVAASKCRKRKQEHTSRLQEHAQNLSRDNQKLQEELAWLQKEINGLSQIALLHKDCKVAELDTHIAQMIQTTASASGNESPGIEMSRQGYPNSYSSAQSLPTALVDRPGSAMSYDFHKLDGSLNLSSPYLTNEQPRAERKKHDAKSEANMESDEYKRELAMRRQNSSTSRVSDTTASEKPGSEYTSAITTPENPAKDAPSPKRIQPERSVRRGHPCRTLDKQRSSAIDPALDGLQGLQDVDSYLAQQH